VPALNQLAWLLATSPDSGVRRGEEALRLSERAVRLAGGADPGLLDTLAAAQAETGRHREATATARRALALAAAAKDQHLADAVRERLALYEAGGSYREPPPPR
jgi:hypothetical protein